jgi:hypothetical protein
MGPDFEKDYFKPFNEGLDRKNRVSRDLLSSETLSDEDDELVNSNDPEHKFIPIDQVADPEAGIDGYFELASETEDEEEDFEERTEDKAFPLKFSIVEKTGYSEACFDAASVDVEKMEIIFIFGRDDRSNNISDSEDRDFSKFEHPLKTGKAIEKKRYSPGYRPKDNLKTMSDSKLQKNFRDKARKLKKKNQ